MPNSFVFHFRLQGTGVLSTLGSMIFYVGLKGSTKTSFTLKLRHTLREVNDLLSIASRISDCTKFTKSKTNDCKGCWSLYSL